MAIWLDDVITALKKLGGEAHLSDINRAWIRFYRLKVKKFQLNFFLIIKNRVKKH